MLQFAMPTVEPAVAAESQARFMAEVAPRDPVVGSAR
jgi:hypothetical protein